MKNTANNIPVKSSNPASSDINEDDYGVMKKILEIQLSELSLKKDEMALNEKALGVQSKQNELLFELEKVKLGTQREYLDASGKRQLIYVVFLLFILLILVLATFAGVYWGKTEDVTKVMLPIITAIIGALGGYGFGFSKGRSEAADDNE